MKTTVKIAYVILSLVFLVYLALPNPDFPFPPADSLQSDEPADIETPLRRAYFTDFTREEVIVNYKKQFYVSRLLNISLPTIRLNYPPEEAQTIIRDQTRSTFLEEFTHPLRESVFISGFEPKSNKDVIYINGKFWRQKIIIRLVPSSAYIRLFVGLVVLFLIPLIFVKLRNSLFLIWKVAKTKWI
jgi:hypothetical protein